VVEKEKYFVATGYVVEVDERIAFAYTIIDYKVQ